MVLQPVLLQPFLRLLAPLCCMVGCS